MNNISFVTPNARVIYIIIQLARDALLCRKKKLPGSSMPGAEKLSLTANTAPCSSKRLGEYRPRCRRYCAKSIRAKIIALTGSVDKLFEELLEAFAPTELSNQDCH